MIEPILDHVPSWLMVMFRLTGLFVLAPMLGSVAIPRLIKVLLVVGLSLAVYPTLLEPGRASAASLGSVIDGGLSLWTLAVRVGMELLIGFAVGYIAALPLIGMQMGGHVIDQQMGLGFAGLVNPDLGGESGVTGELFFLTALALFAILGGHRVMFSILVGSFERVPIGGFHDFGNLLDLVVGTVTTATELALRVGAPLLCLVFLETVAMGFIARTVPQLNILSIGFAIRILVGVVFLTAAAGTAFAVYRDELERVLARLTGFFVM